MAELLVNNASETQPPLRIAIKTPPEQAVEQRHEERHHRDAQHDSWKVALVRSLSDVGSHALRDNSVILPLDVFGHDRRVPRASRCSNSARQIEGSDGGN